MNAILHRLKSFCSSRTVLILFFLGLFASRLIYPLADPPKDLDWSLGLFFDEGIYNQSVRNQTLFGQWALDEWNDYYYSAVSTWIKYLICRVIGVGRVQIRLISIIYSVFSVWLLYLAARESYGKTTALLATVLFGTNYISIMYSRLGMQDTQTLTIFILTFYLWQKGVKVIGAQHSDLYDDPKSSINCHCEALRSNPDEMASSRTPRHDTIRFGFLYLFLSGVICFLSYTYKNLFLYLLPAPILALLVSTVLQMRQPLLRKRGLNGLGMLAAGMSVAFLIWYVAFYRPYHALIGQFGKFFTEYQMFPDANPWQLLLNVYQTPFFKYFSDTPIITGGALLFVWYVSLRIWSARRAHTPPSDLFLVFWFLAGFGFTGIIAYRPTRYFLPLIPPMCLMTARILDRLIFCKQSISTAKAAKNSSDAEFRRVLSLRNSALPFAPFAVKNAAHWTWYPISAVWLTFIMYRYLLRWGPLDFYNTSPAMILSIVIAAALTGLLGYASVRWQNRAFVVPTHWLRVCGICLLLLTIYVEGRAYSGWVSDPQYQVVTMEQDLRQLLGANAAIGGMDAPGVAYDTPYRTVISYDQFVNYAENPIQKYRLTHLFLGQNEAFPETHYYKQRYHDDMLEATLLRQYSFQYGSGTIDFNLFSLIEPKVKLFGEVASDNKPGSSFQLTIKTENRDFRQSRKLWLNWFLYQHGQFEETPISSGQEVSIRLLPKQASRVTLTGHLPDEPGRYDLLLSWGSIKEVRYEAEAAQHQLGASSRDLAAWNTQAIVHDPAGSPGEGFLVYGCHYQDDQPGAYETVFRLKAESTTPADVPLVRIEVVARYGAEMLGQQTLYGPDFATAGVYQDFALPYRLTAFTPDVEYRIYVFGKTGIWADTIHTLYREGVWYDQALHVVSAP